MTGDNYNFMRIMWKPSDTVALAVSGGIDSMVLYHMLRTRYKNTYRKLILLHVNHGLRLQSSDEEEYIIEIGALNGHTVSVKHLSLSGDFSQGKARTLRYQFFKAQCREHDAAILLTAHHRDDHYETILHQLLTGRHLGQALGVKTSGNVDGLPVARPLAAMSKEKIRDYQEEHHVHYFEDETNAGDDYTRNYIRHHLMPVIRNSDHLHEGSLSRVAEDMDALKALARVRASEFIDSQNDQVLRISSLNNESHIIKVFIIQEWLCLYDIYAGRKFIEELITVILGDSSQSDLYIEDKIIKLRYDELFVEHNSENNVKLMDKDFVVTNNGIYRFNGYDIDVNLPDDMLPVTVRSKTDGDVMRLPNLGRKKLSRIFIDSKIPLEERKKMPVIVNKDNEIIALGTIYNIIKSQENYIGLNISKEKAHEFEE